jgi:DNA-binding NtrC family response regulator
VFLEDIGRSMGCRPASISDEARAALSAHEWPGNVRELRNVLERATILCLGGLITPEHMALRSATRPSTVSGDLDEIVRRRIEQTLHETDWNISRSAKRLGLTRPKLYVRLRKYQLERPNKHDVD